MRILLLVLCLPLCSIAQNDHERLIDSFMQAKVSVKNFNGNVLVARSGNIVYQKAFGYRNYETKEKLDNNSVFELASVSKQFTAMGILLLKEQGKLKLSDSLRKFFPELPYHNISIRHLLTHTSGLPDYESAMNAKWDRKKIAFNKDVINFLATEKPKMLFEPGAKWEYSNTAYMLLASIIEQVSGKTFGDFMHANVFKPLGMTQTRIYNTRRSSKEIIPNYAYGFVYSEGHKRYMLPDSIPALSFVYYLDGIQGDGIVNSTTGDLLKWDRALKNNRLLPEATQKEMLSAQAFLDSTKSASYGYGVFQGKDKFGTNLYHSGGWPGYYTFMTRNLEDDITIIVLSNNVSNSQVLSHQLSYILHNEQIEFPYVPKEISLDPITLSKYPGKYQGKAILEIVNEGGKLYRKGNPSIELKPESATRLFYADATDRKIEFEVDETGAVNKAWFIADGIRSELKKLD